MEAKKIKIVNIDKLGLLHGKIHLLKVNYSWDSKRENQNLINSKEDYLSWILDIDKDIKDLYTTN